MWRISRRSLASSKRIVSSLRRCHLTQSYDHGIEFGGKYQSKTLGEMFRQTCERLPDKEAVIFHRDQCRRTFSQLYNEVEELSAGLLALGLEWGDRVGIWGQNHHQWIVTMLACARAGLILVNVNPAYRSAELQYAVNKVEMKALIMTPTFKTSNYYEILREIVPELDFLPADLLHSEHCPSLRYVIMTEGEELPGAYQFGFVQKLGTSEDREKVAKIEKQLQFDDPMNIQFTSGTTGNPKGVTLTHHNLVNNGYIVGEILQSDRICIPVPLYHCFGMVLGSLNAITHGHTQIFPERGFDALATLEAIHYEKAKAVFGTPVMFIDILNHPQFDQFDCSSLQTGIMAGSPCPIEVMNQIVERMTCTGMTIAYGLTETSPAVNMTSPDTSIEKRVSTIGKVLPGVEVKVVDEQGAIVGVGEQGELCYRGHPIMQGYWEDNEKTSEAIDHNNWFHTGDIGEIDADGYCKVVGRLKDMIIRGGENIYPTEVEQFLYKHPAIEDVQVVGVPDKRMGEEAAAVIRLKKGSHLTAEEIKDFCRGQISHHKIPRYIRFVEEFPLTVTGKVKKNLMREELAKLMDDGHL